MVSREVKKHVDGLNSLLHYSVFGPTYVTAFPDSTDGINIIADSEANPGTAFHYLEEVVDYCRAHKLSSYATIRDGKILVKVF